MFPSLDIPFEYWIEHVTFELLYVIFRFSTSIFYQGVLGFATDCPCGVWCRGLITCFLYVGPRFGNLVRNDNGLGSLTYLEQHLHCFPLCFTYILVPNTMVILYIHLCCLHVLTSTLLLSFYIDVGPLLLEAVFNLTCIFGCGTDGLAKWWPAAYLVFGA